MLYNSVNVFGEQVRTFSNREAALDAFAAGEVDNVYNDYKPGYSRELTRPVWSDTQQKFIKPALAECVSRDVV